MDDGVVVRHVMKGDTQISKRDLILDACYGSKGRMSPVPNLHVYYDVAEYTYKDSNKAAAALV